MPDDARGPGDDFLQEVGRLLFVRRDARQPLHRRCQLDQVPDARFHARLHQKVQQAPDAPRDEGGDACLHRLDHRLRPPRHLTGVRFHLDPEDPEVPPVVPAQLVSVALPPRHAAQRARLAVDFGAGTDLGEPTEHRLDRLAALVPGQRRCDERLAEATCGGVGRAAGGQRLATRPPTSGTAAITVRVSMLTVCGSCISLLICPSVSQWKSSWSGTSSLVSTMMFRLRLRRKKSPCSDWS